jgi:hypothetical protein
MTRGWTCGKEAADDRVSDPLQRAIRSRFTRRPQLEAGNLLLRQELVILRRKSSTRVRLWNIDRLLLVWLYRLYSSLLDAIIIVQPETVLRWHRRGLRAYWRWKSRQVGGRTRIDCEIRALIRRMSRENPLLGRTGDPRQIVDAWNRSRAESTVSRYMVRRALSGWLPAYCAGRSDRWHDVWAGRWKCPRRDYDEWSRPWSPGQAGVLQPRWRSRTNRCS